MPCAIALVIELRTREIPNWLTLGTLLFGPPVLVLADRHIVDHFAGFVIAAVVTAVLYRNDWLGGGGVKLTCALGAIIGGLQTLVMLATVGLCVLVLYTGSKIRQRIRKAPPPLLWFASSPFLFLGLAGCLAVGFFSRR